MQMRIISIVLISLVTILIRVNVAGSEEQWPEWNDSVRLDFGKCLYSEDSSGTDWPAIGWSLVKQWKLKRSRLKGHAFHRQVLWYCAVFEKSGPKWLGRRPRLILEATWGSPPYARDAKKWKALKSFVDRFERKAIADPCPVCIWWGGPKYDLIPKNWECPLTPPVTKNVFCYVRPR